MSAPTWAGALDAHAGLVEDGASGRLENDIVAGVAFVELEFDFFFEVVLFVLGFPVAVRQVEGIDQCAVDDDGGAAGALDAVLGDERELHFATALGEKVLEGAADGHFVIDVEVSEMAEGLIVGGDGSVRRLEIELHVQIQFILGSAMRGLASEWRVDVFRNILPQRLKPLPSGLDRRAKALRRPKARADSLRLRSGQASRCGRN